MQMTKSEFLSEYMEKQDMMDHDPNEVAEKLLLTHKVWLRNLVQNVIKDLNTDNVDDKVLAIQLNTYLSGVVRYIERLYAKQVENPNEREEAITLYSGLHTKLNALDLENKISNRELSTSINEDLPLQLMIFSILTDVE